MLLALHIAAACSIGAAPAGTPSVALPIALPTAHLFAPPTSLTVEQLKVGTDDHAELKTDLLQSQLILSATLASKAVSHLCPHRARVRGKTVLRCSSPRLTATLDRTAGLLTLVELRGIPWRTDSDGPPTFLYNPLKLDAPVSFP